MQCIENRLLLAVVVIIIIIIIIIYLWQFPFGNLFSKYNLNVQL